MPFTKQHCPLNDRIHISPRVCRAVTKRDQSSWATRKINLNKFEGTEISHNVLFGRNGIKL